VAKVVGVLGAQQLEQSYAPTLDFRLEPLQLKLTDPATQLEATAAGTLQHTMDVPRQMEAFGLAVPVGTARTMSLLVGLPAAMGAAAGLVAMRRRLQDEADHIELRHGHRIVPVTAVETTNEIDVTSMQDLARLAEQHGSLILRRQGTLSKDYLLRADGVVYRYRAGDAGRGRIEPPIASAARFADVPTPPSAPRMEAPAPAAAPAPVVAEEPPPVEPVEPTEPLVPAEPLIDGTYRFRSGDGYVAD
jgi:hypothetical protein